MVLKAPTDEITYQIWSDLFFKIVQYWKKYRDPYVGNWKYIISTLKMSLPFDHIITILEIYPKKTDRQKDSKKLPTFLFIVAKKLELVQNPQNYMLK